MFHFHPINKTCRKLVHLMVFTRSIVVFKSGLKNNWMKKLDRVNRHFSKESFTAYLKIVRMIQFLSQLLLKFKEVTDAYQIFVRVKTIPGK